MQGRLQPPPFASRVAPAAYWSRRDLINRSYAWFRVIPRGIRPVFTEACRDLAAFGGSPPQATAVPAVLVPGLRAFARELLFEITEGSGVVYLSGLSVPEGTLEDAALRWAYALIGRELGSLVGPGGGLLDLGGGQRRCYPRRTGGGPPGSAGAGGDTLFHTDSDGAGLIPDLVGMLCLQPAKSGGACQVTSAFRAHELLRGRYGDLLSELYAPFVRSVVSLSSVPVRSALPRAARTAVRTRRAPVFAAREGEPGVRFEYLRYQIEKAHQEAGAPLTARQVEAFDRLDEALADPAACVQFLMRRGEMLFIDNRAVAHNRRDFVDHPEPRRKRAMVRMWVSLAGEDTDGDGGEWSASGAAPAGPAARRAGRA